VAALRPAKICIHKHLELISVKSAEPSHKGVVINYHVHKEIPLKIDVLNLHGELVTTLKQERHRCGRFTLEWNGRNGSDHWVSSDLYFVQFNTEDGAMREKFVFLK